MADSRLHRVRVPRRGDLDRGGQEMPPVREADPGVASTRLFVVASLALMMAGIGASLRANTAADLQRVFIDPIDKAHSAERIATILGLPFLGFALTIAIGSPLLDYIGMGLLLPVARICF